MITISEKDGATIIVIENPSGSEQRVIEQARNALKVSSSEVWGKFKNAKPKKDAFSMEGFYEIVDCDDIPF